MKDDFETVEGPSSGIVDSIYAAQKERVSRMRSNMLSCSDDPVTSRQAMQNVTVLRVYHQVARIIKYLELMDKLEDKLYESIEYEIDTADIQNETTWIKLLTIQQKLQKTMLDSHKLLEPYLNAQEFQVVELVPANTESSAEGAAALMSASDRDKLRTNAQNILKLLGESGNNE